MTPEPPGRLHAPHSLSRTLFILTVCIVLLTGVIIFLPGLARERLTFLDNRIREAYVLAAAGDADTTLSAAQRDAILALARAESVRIDRPGRREIVVEREQPASPAEPIDLQGEGDVGHLLRALHCLAGLDPDLLTVTGHPEYDPGTSVTIVMRAHLLKRALIHYTAVYAIIALAIAAVMGGAIYVAVHMLLVAPMRRLTGSIVAFGADPERTVPVSIARRPQRQDEVSVAARELAVMQRELRAALWRNARLAALGTAMAKISHDLRGILAPALLSAETLQMHADPAVRRAGDRLVRAVDRATDLVRDTLEFTREGPPPPARERVDLRRVVEEAFETAHPGYPRLHLADDVPAGQEIVGDRDQLFRGLLNLMRNAAEAGATEIRVSCARPDRGIEIELADNGPGLPDDVRSALFQPFLSGGRRGGTGLGLAIARDLIRAHGGDITLARTGPDGTAFRIVLPPSALPARSPNPAAQVG